MCVVCVFVCVCVCVCVCARARVPVPASSRAVQHAMAAKQPYGYRPIGQGPRVLTDSLPEGERQRAQRQRQIQKTMKSYKVECGRRKRGREGKVLF